MSDLFTPLRELDLPTEPLPSDEVRRRGDRRRRRRHSVVGLGAAAAALVVVGAVASATDAMTDRSAGETVQQPTPGAGAIPEDFPLGVGLPLASRGLDMRGADYVPRARSVGPVCGVPYQLVGRPIDRAAIEGTNPQYLGLRDLAVYGSSSDAVAAADALVGRLRACPRDENDGSSTLTTVRPIASFGDRAWQGLRSYAINGRPTGLEIYYVVQRGPAVTVLHEQVPDDAALLPDARADHLRDYEHDTVRPVVWALCDIDGVDC